VGAGPARHELSVSRLLFGAEDARWVQYRVIQIATSTMLQRSKTQSLTINSMAACAYCLCARAHKNIKISVNSIARRVCSRNMNRFF
jgi:hypothetical protein